MTLPSNTTKSMKQHPSLNIVYEKRIKTNKTKTNESFFLSNSSATIVMISLADKEDANSPHNVTKKRGQKNILSEENESWNSFIISIIGKEDEQNDGETVRDQRFAVRECACKKQVTRSYKIVAVFGRTPFSTHTRTHARTHTHTHTHTHELSQKRVKAKNKKRDKNCE